MSATPMDPLNMGVPRRDHERTRHGGAQLARLLDVMDSTVKPPTSGEGPPSLPVWFAELWSSEYAAMVRLARLLLGSGNAEDAVQEAFQRVYRFALSGRTVRNPGGLLRSTTINVCRSWQLSRRRQSLRMVRHGPGDSTVSDWTRELDESLRRLPYEQRAVIVLRYWVGCSEAEIAHLLECKPGTVKSRHTRALRTLRKELS